MTQEEIENFKSNFKSVVYLKGRITKTKNHISKLYSWDKNGSCQNAINKSETLLKDLKQQFKSKLNLYCEHYEDLLIISAKLSKLNADIKLKNSALIKANKNLELYNPFV